MNDLSPEALLIVQRAQQARAPHPDAKARVAQALAAGGAPAPSSDSASAWSGSKLLGTIGAVLLAGATTIALWSSSAEPQAEPTPAPAPTQQLAAAVPNPVPGSEAIERSDDAIAPEPARIRPAPARARSTPVRAPAIDRLDQERALLAQARRQLGASEAQAALRLLQQAAHDFAPSALDPERLALTARAHCQLGDRALAEQLAAQLDPSSPYQNLVACPEPTP